MKKIFLFGLMFLGLGATALFGEGKTLSGDLDNIINQGVGTAKVAGAGFLYIVAAYLPPAIIIGATVYGWFGALKERQPNDSAFKMVTAAMTNGLYGYIAAVVIWALIGLLATGDPTKGVVMTYHFWSSGLETVAGNDVFSGK